MGNLTKLKGYVRGNLTKWSFIKLSKNESSFVAKLHTI